MSTLRFNDGIEFDTSGAYRVEERHDGHYVVGHGLLCAVGSREEGEALIRRLESNAAPAIDWDEEAEKERRR